MLLISERNCAFRSADERRKITRRLARFGVFSVGPGSVQVFFCHCGEISHLAILMPRTVVKSKDVVEIELDWNHYERVKATYDPSYLGFICQINADQFVRLSLDHGVSELNIIEKAKLKMENAA